MRSQIALAIALFSGPALADCPLPTPRDLGAAIEAAKAETRRFRFDADGLEPKLRALTPQELAHYVTDLARGKSPSGYDRAMALSYRVAADEGETALLRHAVDYDGDGYSTVRILAHDVDDQELVRQVLATFAPEPDGPAVGVKLLSDVDDTIYASLVDPRYEMTGARYPGVEALYRAIAEEPDAVSTRFSGLPLVTLSARPEIRGFDAVKRSLDGVKTRFDGPICGMSLGGELISSALGTVFTLKRAKLPSTRKVEKMRRLHQESDGDLAPEDVSFLARQENRIGQVKFENYRRFTLVYPSYDYVFFGDSGQADAHAAALIMDHNPRLATPGEAVISFIHDLRVPGDPDGPGMSPTRAVREAVERDDVVLFHNHVQAALIAHRRGQAGEIRQLVDADELVAVVEAALTEVEDASFKSAEIAGAVAADLAADAAEAVVAARAAGASPADAVLDQVASACETSGAACVAFR